MSQSARRAPADPLEQARTAAGEVRTDAALAYGIASIAADIRRLVDHITGTTHGDAQ